MMIAYPISISSDGGLSISSDPNVDNVRALLDTSFYERCMFPNYGVNLNPFDPVSYQDLNILLLSLNLAVKLWHDFATNISLVSDDLENGNLQILLEVDGDVTEL